MPKFSISKLEEARKNPMQFAMALSGTAPMEQSGFGKSKYLDWQNAVTNFHNTGKKSASINYLTNAFSQHFKQNRKNDRELEEYILKLEEYIEDVSAKGLFLDEKNRNISIDLNPKLTITGRIPLIYLNSNNGYSVFFFQKEDVHWQDDMKFPIVQDYFANTVFGCPLSQVEVGVFCLKTGEHSAQSYPDVEIANSISELKALGETIVSYFK